MTFTGSLVLCCAALLSLASGAAAQSLPPKLRAALQGPLKASPQQLQAIERGGVVAYRVETGAADDVMLVGVARIWATPAAFVSQYRDVVEFEKAPGVLASGKFSVPPRDADLAALRFSRDEVNGLRACRPGDCSFKIGRRGMQYLQSQVNWKSPGYVDQANRVLREMWLRYLREYQRRGDAALAEYHDGHRPFRVEKGLEDLMRATTVLSQRAPEMERFLLEYPKPLEPWNEEFFYWQVGDFGLKPVHRLTHVVIGKGPGELGEAYLIASKMLLASHYFRSAIELRFLVPGQDQRKGGMHYLVCVQRSYVDGLTGFKGGVLRGTVYKKSRAAMEDYIRIVKKRVERQFNQPKRASAKPRSAARAS